MKRSKIYNFILACILLVAIERFCHWQTGGFRLAKATTTHLYPFKASPLPPPQGIYQSFSFLGSGVQFYVFVGEDQQTILKLFKHHHTGPSNDLVATLFPKRFAQTIFNKREKRMSHLLKSAQIAFQYLPKETGVFYIHLQKTDQDLGSIPLYDKIGIAHQLNLDQTEFILQKRIQPLTERLNDLFQRGQIDKALQSMDDLLLLIENRSKAGIKNKDGKILKNCGFLGDEPIEMDIGSYVLRKESKCPNPHQKARLKATLQLLSWVKCNYPSYLSICREKLIDENAL